MLVVGVDDRDWPDRNPAAEKPEVCREPERPAARFQRGSLVRSSAALVSALLACGLMNAGHALIGAERLNIVLIVSDDQRPDTIHALGNQAIRTPNLDRLALRGTTFDRAYAGYPICHVSRAQILTGCDAFRALPEYPRGSIDPSLATLAGTLGAAGYHTCYSGKWHNDGHPLQRGYSCTGGLYSSGGAKEVVLPPVDERGRPLTGYRGWTFKDAKNRPQQRSEARSRARRHASQTRPMAPRARRPKLRSEISIVKPVAGGAEIIRCGPKKYWCLRLQVQRSTQRQPMPTGIACTCATPCTLQAS